ncbi:glycosyltransferase [Clostridium thermosuccinogenes]|nr:glycosyltransferase [Pseudoclostridium thermosuccinogenes]
MKKRLLFVIDSLGLGGAEKSLINLLHSLDYEQYEVDLFLFYKKGMFLDLLPSQVKVLEHTREWAAFQLPFLKSLASLAAYLRFDLAYHRAMLSIKSKLCRMTQPRQQKLWNHLSPAAPFIYDEYDAAIGYLEKYPDYFIAEKVNAKKKIGWIHIDYIAYGLNSEYDRPYFEKLDYIAAVSDSCVEALKQCFPDMEDKFVLVENISCPKLIKEMANHAADIDAKDTLIVTAARLAEQKGIDLSIEAARLLQKDGYEFRWIILGDGPLKEEYSKRIIKYGLEGKFILKGAVPNPYPYMKAADIYVQTSRFEGKSLSIDEAKILGKPIVATRFPTVYDQIHDGLTGILSDIDAISIYEKIRFLIDNPDARQALQNNLSKEKTDYESKVKGFYRLIG